jgi:hypothetical protein
MLAGVQTSEETRALAAAEIEAYQGPARQVSLSDLHEAKLLLPVSISKPTEKCEG